jgi:hypothetical protein
MLRECSARARSFTMRPYFVKMHMRKTAVRRIVKLPDDAIFAIASQRRSLI